MPTRTRPHDRPPVVVVCPRCDGGIFQNRINHPIDCPDCSYIDRDALLMDYEIVRFDCPDCGADIKEGYSSRNLAGGDYLETIISVRCPECEINWELPHH